MEKPKQNHRPLSIFPFALAIAIVLLYLILRDLDWNSFWNTIRNGNYWFILIILPLGSLNYLLRAIRWRILINSEHNVAVISVFWANMVGYLGNAYLPARAGELLRSAVLGRIIKLGTSFVLATALTERVLDAVALVLVGSALMAAQSSIPAEYLNAFRGTAIISLAGLIVIVLLSRQDQLATSFLEKFRLPEKYLKAVSGQISRFLIGMQSLQNTRRLTAFLVLTGIIWLADALANVIGVHIIGQTLSIGQALILLAALGLSSSIPSTPGYVGVYQFVAITVLVPFGFARTEALAYILVSQILNYTVVTFWGLIGLWQTNRPEFNKTSG